MSYTQDLVASNNAYANHFCFGELSPDPIRRLAVVMCIDARLRAFGFLGISEGDAHIIRNAGARITDEVLQTLAISQHVYGTREIAIVQHTDCNMGILATLLASENSLASLPGESTMTHANDAEEEIRLSLTRIHESTLVIYKDSVRGYIYDVADGTLREVIA